MGEAYRLVWVLTLCDWGHVLVHLTPCMAEEAEFND